MAFLLPCLRGLLLLLLALAATQVQAQQMSSFPANDSRPWLPTETSRILVSPSLVMAAGFVPSSASAGKYRFAVWVANVSGTGAKTIIWYAHNTTNPLEADALEADGNSTLLVNAAGVLAWTSDNNTVWSQASTANSTAPPQLTLNVTGSLFYGPSWSSFREPTNTLMPAQAIRQADNSTPGGAITLQSANGRYKLVNAMTLNYYSPEPGAAPSAYANMTGVSSLLNLTDDGVLKLSGGAPATLIASDMGAKNRLRRLTLDDDGNLRLYSLNPATRNWSVVWELVQELCTIQGTCPGNNTICVPAGADGVTCVCPPGFRDRTDGNGCEAKKMYSGRGTDDRFVRMDFVSFSGGAFTKASDPGQFMQKLPPTNLLDCQSSCRPTPTARRSAISSAATGRASCTGRASWKGTGPRGPRCPPTYGWWRRTTTPTRSRG